MAQAETDAFSSGAALTGVPGLSTSGPDAGGSTAASPRRAGVRHCPVCGDEMTASPNIHEMNNGYIYARDVDECSRCRRHWTSGRRRFIEHLTDAKAEAAKSVGTGGSNERS